MTPTGQIKAFPTARWEDITRYDDYLRAAADPVGWPLDRLRGHIVIESAGDPDAIQRNSSNGYSYGLFQIVPYGVGWGGWHALVSEKAGLGRNYTEKQIIQALYDPEVNCRVGVAILETFYQQHGTLDKASSTFFLGNPNWRGQDTVNGNSGLWYRDTLNALIKEQQAFAPPDLISYIVSGARYTAEFGFGMPNINASGVPQNYYAYGVGHGEGLRAAHQHTGIDISIPLYTPLRTPFAGVVRCIGNTGSGDWGQGCGAFPDTVSGGIGNVTVLTDVGLKITFGHVNSSTLRVGQRVAAGDTVARSGGMVGPHVHLDVSINAPERVNRSIAVNGGDYWLLDPIPAIAKALGQEIPAPPPTYADPRPLPQPREFDVSVTVTATKDNVPVLSRAALDSAPSNKPLAKGDTFEAVYQVLGNDHNTYWVSTRGSRIPIDGTAAPDWKGFNLVVTTPPPVVCPPQPNLTPAIEDLEALQELAQSVIDYLKEPV
jgi:murein DD-endopeptidase MepM/ murein hydrolase activator NlpD